MMSDILIRINKLRFKYDSADQNFELKVDGLNVYRNKITSIIGSSGNGKSSLLELIGLIRKPNNFEQSNIEYNLDEKYSIKYLWENKAEAERLKRESFGFIFQTPFFLEDLSIRRNSEFNFFLRDKNKNLETDILIHDHLYNSKIFDLHERKIFKEKIQAFGHILTSSVSGGQKQRFSILKATLPGTEIIFADEPTGNLDPINSFNVFKYLERWVKSDTKNTLVMVTHDIDCAIQFSDHLVIIDSENEIKRKNCFLGKNEVVKLNKESILSILKRDS